MTNVLVTEQASGRILVLDPGVAWSAPAPELWSWRPPNAGRGAKIDNLWGLPTDARLRSVDGGQRLLVSDSLGLVAIVAYPEGGEPIWSADLGPQANPHGIELLPGGNVAVAASTGNFVRLYAAWGGKPTQRCVTAELPDAHQVLWDATRETLWALGRAHLVEYVMDGTPARPSLVRRRRHRLPTSDGHDLQPVPHDADRLWLTTRYGVHQFRKSSARFDEDFRWSDALYRSQVKSIGTDPVTGWVLQTKPDAAGPEHWWTDHLDLFLGARRRRTNRLPGTRIYRARWLHPDSN